jgi:uracil-DNA glycosylase
MHSSLINHLPDIWKKNLLSLDQVKIVLIRQDSYHGLSHTHELSFSVKSGITHPQRLRNIFKELHISPIDWCIL